MELATEDPYLRFYDMAETSVTNLGMRRVILFPPIQITYKLANTFIGTRPKY